VLNSRESELAEERCSQLCLLLSDWFSSGFKCVQIVVRSREEQNLLVSACVCECGYRTRCVKGRRCVRGRLGECMRMGD
jgi:hypothetical protein